MRSGCRRLGDGRRVVGLTVPYDRGMQMWDTFRSVAQFDSFEFDATTRRLKRVASVEDLRRLAKRRLPAGVFDYIDGGAEDERTLGTNSSDFSRLELRPRSCATSSDLDTSTSIFGVPASMPVILSPTGFTRIAHSEGELAVTRAAERAGVPWSLSTMGTRSIEECAEANPEGRSGSRSTPGRTGAWSRSSSVVRGLPATARSG